MRAKTGLAAGVAAIAVLLAGCGGGTAGQAQVATDYVTGTVETRTATSISSPLPTTPAVDIAAVSAALAAAASLTPPDIKTVVTDVGARLTALKKAAAVCGAMVATPSLMDYLHNLNTALATMGTTITAVHTYAAALKQDADKAAAAGGASDPRVVLLRTNASKINSAADDATTLQQEAAIQAQTALGKMC